MEIGVTKRSPSTRIHPSRIKSIPLEATRRAGMVIIGDDDHFHPVGKKHNAGADGPSAAVVWPTHASFRWVAQPPVEDLVRSSSPFTSLKRS